MVTGRDPLGVGPGEAAGRVWQQVVAQPAPRAAAAAGRHVLVAALVVALVVVVEAALVAALVLDPVKMENYCMMQVHAKIQGRSIYTHSKHIHNI